jgi:hypothetical protein
MLEFISYGINHEFLVGGVFFPPLVETFLSCENRSCRAKLGDDWNGIWVAKLGLVKLLSLIKYDKSLLEGWRERVV